MTVLIVVFPKLAQIVFTGFLYAPYKGLPSVNNILRARHFLCLFVNTFSWPCGSLHEPWKLFSLCAFTFFHTYKLL